MSTVAKLDCKEILKAVRGILEPIYGERLRGLVLYGSVARGDYNQDSDVDILVVLDELDKYGEEMFRMGKSLYPYSLEIDRPISASPVSEAIYQSDEYPLYINAKREGIEG